MASNDDILFAKIAVKNKLVTEDQINKCIDVQKKLAVHGKAKSLPQILSEIGFLKPEQVKKIQGAQEKSRKIQVSVLQAELIVQQGHVDKPTIDEFLNQAKEEDFSRTVGQILLEKNLLTPEQLKGIQEKVKAEMTAEGEEEHVEETDQSAEEEAPIAQPQALSYSPKEETLEINSIELAKNIEEVKARKQKSKAKTATDLSSVGSPEELTKANSKEETVSFHNTPPTNLLQAASRANATSLPPLKKQTTSGNTSGTTDMSSLLIRRKKKARALKTILIFLGVIGALALGGTFFIAYTNSKHMNNARYHYDLEEYEKALVQLNSLIGNMMVDVEKVEKLRKEISFHQELHKVKKLSSEHHYSQALEKLSQIQPQLNTHQDTIESIRQQVRFSQHIYQADQAYEQKNYSQAFLLYKEAHKLKIDVNTTNEKIERLVNKLYRQAQFAKQQKNYRDALTYFALMQKNALTSNKLWKQEIQLCYYFWHKKEIEIILSSERVDAISLKNHLDSISLKAKDYVSHKKKEEFKKLRIQCQNRIACQRYKDQARASKNKSEKLKFLFKAFALANGKQKKVLALEIKKLKSQIKPK